MILDKMKSFVDIVWTVIVFAFTTIFALFLFPFTLPLLIPAVLFAIFCVVVVVAIVVAILKLSLVLAAIGLVIYGILWAADKIVNHKKS